METVIKNKHLKDTFKEALIEVLETRKDLLVDAFTEAIEETGLLNAIKDGDKNDLVKEEVIMNYLSKQINRKKKNKS